MADRLTQLQDCINLQAENFCNSIGIIQQTAKPRKLSEKKSKSNNGIPKDDNIELFAIMIARTAKDIEALIDSLPNDRAVSDLQANHLQQAEMKNNEAARRLQEVVEQAEVLLAQVQEVLYTIGNQHLSLMRKPFFKT